jgi:hypothetical protein
MSLLCEYCHLRRGYLQIICLSAYATNYLSKLSFTSHLRTVTDVIR